MTDADGNVLFRVWDSPVYKASLKKGEGKSLAGARTKRELADVSDSEEDSPKQKKVKVDNDVLPSEPRLSPLPMPPRPTRRPPAPRVNDTNTIAGPSSATLEDVPPHPIRQPSESGGNDVNATEGPSSVTHSQLDLPAGNGSNVKGSIVPAGGAQVALRKRLIASKRNALLAEDAVLKEERHQLNSLSQETILAMSDPDALVMMSQLDSMDARRGQIAIELKNLE